MGCGISSCLDPMNGDPGGMRCPGKNVGTAGSLDPLSGDPGGVGSAPWAGSIIGIAGGGTAGACRPVLCNAATAASTRAENSCTRRLCPRLKSVSVEAACTPAAPKGPASAGPAAELEGWALGPAPQPKPGRELKLEPPRGRPRATDMAAGGRLPT
mmetsp:Transcript_73853/g.192297  ORF Transcript_73853/g.192297 Transcript_73853/m.192297 type:complete len:156 (+) Transcript_73853:585-1052(+)